MTFRRKIEISVSLALVISVLFSIFSFAKTAEKIRGEVLRLHIIANSDSDADQELKLKVRDTVLAEGAEIFDGSVNIENAVEKITPEIPRLTETARRVITENGFDYGVKITLCRDWFITRTYETVTLPAGEYLALKIVIGKGEGHNWWCVMFPAMCLPAAAEKREIETVLNRKEVRLVEKKPRYEPRFKIVELYEDLKNKFNG